MRIRKSGLERTLLNIEEQYRHFFNMDKSVDKRHLSDYNAGSMACFPFEERQWSNMWFLEHIAVHPAYRAIGIGQNLVRWGMEHADIEGVPVGVEARGGKKLRLWKSLGFEKLNEIEAPYGGKLCAMSWDAIYLIE
jgi:GNAT superfamily N-acetyltransferase